MRFGRSIVLAICLTLSAASAWAQGQSFPDLINSAPNATLPLGDADRIPIIQNNPPYPGITAFLYPSQLPGGGGGSLAIGAPITGGTPSYVLYETIGGLLGQLPTVGSGSVVLSTSPTIVTPTLSGNVTATGNLTVDGTSFFSDIWTLNPNATDGVGGGYTGNAILLYTPVMGTVGGTEHQVGEMVAPCTASGCLSGMIDPSATWAAHNCKWGTGAEGNSAIPAGTKGWESCYEGNIATAQLSTDVSDLYDAVHIFGGTMNASGSINTSILEGALVNTGSGNSDNITTSYTATSATSGGIHTGYLFTDNDNSTSGGIVQGFYAISTGTRGGNSAFVANGVWATSFQDQPDAIGEQSSFSKFIGVGDSSLVNPFMIFGYTGEGNGVFGTYNNAPIEVRVNNSPVAYFGSNGFLVDNPGGGGQGAGTINVSGGYFVNGTPISSAASITVGATTIGSSTPGYILNVNGTVLGQVGTTGSGLVALATGPTFVTPVLGAASATSLALTGGTVTNVPTPVNFSDAANKGYVDDASSGLIIGTPVLLGTTAALPSNTYSNGSSGVGATLTAVSNGTLVVDSVTPSVGNRILVKNEATPANNGVYAVTTVGNGSTHYVLTRTTDYDTTAQIKTNTFFFVQSGTVNTGTGWVMSTAGTITVGTTNIVFNQFSSSSSYMAGAGLNLTGNIFSVANGGITDAMLAATTGSGAVALATGPTFVTPTLGVASATSLNGLTITPAAGTLTIASGKTLTDTSGIGAKLLIGTTGGGFTGYTGCSGVTHEWISALSIVGACTQTQPATTDLSDISTFSINTSGTIKTTNTTASTTPTTGALIVSAGGVGIGGAINTSGTITAQLAETAARTTSGQNFLFNDNSANSPSPFWTFAGGNFDNVISMVTQTSGTTLSNTTAYAAYAINNGGGSGGYNTVLYYGQAVAAANNSAVWGNNPVVYDTHGATGQTLVGAEYDMGATNAGSSGTTVIGVQLVGVFCYPLHSSPCTTKTPPKSSVGYAIYQNPFDATAPPWQYGFLTSDASAYYAVDIGAVAASGANVASQLFNFHYFDAGSTRQTIELGALSSGFLAVYNSIPSTVSGVDIFNNISRNAGTGAALNLTTYSGTAYIAEIQTSASTEFLDINDSSLIALEISATPVLEANLTGVGLGGIAPLVTLDVGGTTLIQGTSANPTSGAGLNLFYNGTGSIVSFNFAGGGSYLPLAIAGSTVEIGSTSTMTFSTAGLFISGIANSNAGYYLCWNSGTVEYAPSCASSTRGVKRDITRLDPQSALAEVMKLEPVEFRYKEGLGYTDQMHVGLIAEDVEAVDRRLADYTDAGKLEGVDYIRSPALAFAAIQALKREFDEYKRKHP